MTIGSSANLSWVFNLLNTFSGDTLARLILIYSAEKCSGGIGKISMRELTIWTGAEDVGRVQEAIDLLIEGGHLRIAQTGPVGWSGEICVSLPIATDQEIAWARNHLFGPEKSADWRDE